MKLISYIYLFSINSRSRIYARSAYSLTLYCILKVLKLVAKHDFMQSQMTLTPWKSNEQIWTRWDFYSCSQTCAVARCIGVVIFCFRHETVPLVHEVPRLEDFTGHVLHSHDFRNPDRYRGQVVLCVGSGSSSADIGGIVASEAKLVIPDTILLLENINLS